MKKYIQNLDLKKTGLIVLGAVLLIQFILLFTIEAQIAGVHRNSSRAIDEVGQSREFITDFGNDLNEIRSLLLLPTKSYGFEEQEAVVVEAEDTLFANVFTYISDLGSGIKYDESSAALYDFRETVEDLNFTYLQEGDTYKILNEYLTTLYRLEIDGDGEIVITNYFYEPVESLEEIFTNYSEIEEEIAASETIRANLYNMLYVEGEAYDALYAQGMWFEGQYEGETSFEYYLVTQDQDRLATIKLEKSSDSITWQNLVTGETSEMEINASEIATLINELDGRTDLEKDIEEAEEKLWDLMEDEAFQKALGENDLTISEEARIEEFGIYFDIYDLNGTVLSTIYIDTRTGKVMVEADGVSEELISAVADDSSKKKRWICLKPFQTMKG